MTATFRIDDQNSNTYARFPVKVKQTITTFTAADTNSIKLIAQGDTTVLGSRLYKILITSDDSVSNIIRFYLNNGTTTSTLPIGFISVPSNSGDSTQTTKNTISVLRDINLDPIVELDNNGNPFIMLSTGWSLHANVVTTVSDSKTIQIVTWLDDY